MKAWIVALAMMGVLSPGQAAAVDDVGAHVLKPTPPKYPPEAARAGTTGTVVLVITVNAAGAVESVMVERSSGHRLLDAAAIDAANEWTYGPAIEHGKPARGRVRVPVDFNMGSEDEPIRAAVADLARRLRVPVVAPDADGTLPQFVQDPLPFEAGDVAAMLALLQAQGKAIDVPGLPDGVAFYELEGENGPTHWEIYTGDVSHAPTMLRKRLTSDGVHGFFVTRVLCESQDTGACARFLAYVQRPERQRAVPLQAPEVDDGSPEDTATGG
jgi:TonB family protein